MQNFSNLVQKKHFQIWGWIDGGKKIAFFNGKLAKSRKRWEIRLRLLWFTNRKWHRPCRMRQKSLTLNDVEGHWQPVRSAILATAELFVRCCNRTTAYRCRTRYRQIRL